MDVSIIIVSYNSRDEIIVNIESIKKKIVCLNYEILIVNNDAKDTQLSTIFEGDDSIRIIEAEQNLGFGRANNLGLEQAKGKYILFVNPDVIFLSDIDQLINALERDPEIGIMGAATFNDRHQVLPSCGEYPSIKNFLSESLFLNHLFPKIKWWGNFSMKYFDFKGTREVDWVSGAFMLGRKSTLMKISGFDKDFFMYGEDIDICWRLKKAGFKIVFSDKASIIHTVGHTVQNKSAKKAKFIVESSRVLWGKHYNAGTVKKLFSILCFGSIVRGIGWGMLSLTNLSKRKKMIAYYDTIISESINYIKE